MKKTLGKAAFLIVLLIIAFWFISIGTTEKRSKLKEQKLETEKNIQTKNIVSGMIAKHNAITDWRKGLGREQPISLEHAYTIEVEDALIKTNGRPILFFGGINDIVSKEDKYLVYFSNWFDSITSADVHFILDCTPDQVNKIRSQPTELFENWAVISQITEVKRIRFDLIAESSSSDEVRVAFAPSNVFIAKGHCLDLVFVGTVGNEDILERPKK